MNRRKDGRELYEVFKEQLAAATQTVKKEDPVFRAEPKVVASEPAVHTFKLGDRRQVELFLSMGWTYGLIFFALLLVFAAFALGRHFAVATEVVEAVQAPPGAVSNLKQVGEVAQPMQPAQLQNGAQQPAQAAQQASVSGQAGTNMPGGAVQVSGGGMFTICVITYFNKGNARAGADEVAKFLQSRNLPDVRVLTDKSHARLIVAVGTFATKNGADLTAMKAELAKTVYKTTRFDKTYVATLKGYE
jgi:hypothetical protein